MYSIHNKRTLRKKSFYNFIAVQLTRSYGYVFNWFQYIPYIKLFLFSIFFTAFCILQRHKTYILWKFKIYNLTLRGMHIFPFEIILLFLPVLGSSKHRANQRQL